MAAPARPEISYAKSRGLSIAYSVAGEGLLDLVVVPGSHALKGVPGEWALFLAASDVAMRRPRSPE